MPDLQDKSLPPTPAAAPPSGPPAQAKKSGADEKREMMDRLQPPKDAKATDAGKQQGDRWAKDPTTGLDVLIKDPQFESASALPALTRDAGANVPRALSQSSARRACSTRSRSTRRGRRRARR